MAELPISKDAKKLSFIGAGLLAIGTLMPVVSLPIVGNMTLFNVAQGEALVVVLLAVVAGVLAYLGHTKHVLWPGLVAVAMLIYGLIQYQMMKSEMRSEMGTAGEDNPFGGLAQMVVDSVSLQWGLVLLAIGAGLLVYAGWLGRKTPAEVTSKEFD